MDIPIRIASMKLVEEEPRPNGNKLIATFDLQVPHVDVRGCLLIRTGRGFFKVLPPPKKNKGGMFCVWLTQPTKPIAVKALETYRAMGGQYGDFIPIAERGEGAEWTDG
jgi:hypothetical protein